MYGLLDSADCGSNIHTHSCPQLLLVLLLPMLFTLLGDTAELYFSPTMAIVAQSIPKMRPRFAGGQRG